MNNEPVAWIRSGDDQLSLVKGEDDGYMVWNPLYTHPASKAKDRFSNYESICLQCGTTIYKPFKELTIEEIIEVSKEIFKGYKNFYHYQINFARALLKKASEK